MVPGATFFAFAVASLFTTALPLALLIWLMVKEKINVLPVMAGVTAFFVSQILIRIPIIGLLSTREWYVRFAALFFPYVIALSLSAGLFEESARLAGALLLKKNRSYKDALSFGLGHAFCEVIVLVGLTHINNIVYSLAVNDTGGALSALVPEQSIAEIRALLVAVAPFEVYLGVLERFSAVGLHLFATVLVFLSVIKRKPVYFLSAIAAHTVFNIAGVALARYAGFVAAEAAMLVMAAAAGYYVYKSRGSFAEDGFPMPSAYARDTTAPVTDDCHSERSEES